jgi:hypothetical protein
MRGALAEAGRQPGSARFAVYYKVQWWDATSLSWLDIQQSFASLAAARGAYRPAGGAGTWK